MIRNRLKHWRHRMEIDTQGKFAVFLGVHQNQVSAWENHSQEPNLLTLWNTWKKLKEHFPEINLQDLIEERPE